MSTKRKSSNTTRTTATPQTRESTNNIRQPLALTVAQPWAWLIAKGYKKIENKDFAVNANKMNKPLAIHVSSVHRNVSERHGVYAIAEVRQVLNMDPATRSLNDTQLDAFFAAMEGRIIAMTKIVDCLTNLQEAHNICEFAGVGIGTRHRYYWKFSQNVLYIDPGISGVAGRQRYIFAIDQARYRQQFQQCVNIWLYGRDPQQKVYHIESIINVTQKIMDKCRELYSTHNCTDLNVLRFVMRQVLKQSYNILNAIPTDQIIQEYNRILNAR